VVILSCLGEAIGASLDEIIEVPMELCALSHWQHCKTKYVADYFNQMISSWKMTFKQGTLKGTHNIFSSLNDRAVLKLQREFKNRKSRCVLSNNVSPYEVAVKVFLARYLIARA